MNTKHFQWQSKNRKYPYFGSITIKADGKVSISISNSKYMSPAERYQMKDFAMKNILPELQVEAEQKEKGDEGALKRELLEKTQDLKEKFIEETKKYAKNLFEYSKKMMKLSQEEWDTKFDVKRSAPTPGNKLGFVITSDWKNRKNYQEMTNTQDKYRTILNKGYVALEEAEVKQAERHYLYATEKLAFRLAQKGVKGGNFVIKKGWVKQNLEITIEHDGKITKAWTIIASGPIQRPHYRYLVK